MHEKAEIIWSQFRSASNFFFYDAVICSLVMLRSACWDGNISQFDRGRLEKIVIKSRSRCGKALDSFKTLYV